MVKSPLPDVPIPNITVHELAFELFRSYRNNVALVDAATGRSYTFFDLIKYCSNVASSLVRLGAKKGEVLAMHSPNTPEYAIMYLGAAAAGVTLTTINPTYTVYEVTKQLEDSGATFMYTIQNFLPTAREAAKKYGKIKKIIVLGEAAPGLVSFTHLLRDDGKAYPMHLTFDPNNDILTIPYSSGTTGLPKGVVLTHRNVVSNFCQYREEELQQNVISNHIDSGKQLTILGLLPFYHSYGQLVIMLFTLMKGTKIVTLTHFEPEPFLTAIQKYKINMLGVVPPLVIFLAKSPLVAKYDLSSVISCLSGAAPLSKENEQEACKVLRIPEVIQGYGLTETSPVATMRPRGWLSKKGGSVGVPLPNSEIQIVEVGSSKILGPNQTGEVWIRGPHIMKGYLNKPQATRETIDSQGWLHTGDVGYYDEDSFFYIVDRIKELIKFKGYQVPPAELEGLLLTHPDVADAGVIGIPDERAGELPKAFVVKKPGHQVTKDSIHALVNKHLTDYKHLRGGIEFIDQIPKSASGKILRRELLAMEKRKSSKL